MRNAKAGRASRVQAELVNFLNIDLDTAFTFLYGADLDRDTDQAYAALIVDRALHSLYTIHYFARRVQDPEQRSAIEARAAELAAAIRDRTPRAVSKGE